MQGSPWAAFWADVVLVVHFAFVLFVAAGFAAILAGAFLRRSWIRHPIFRLSHCAATAAVALQDLLGGVCSLTVLESRFRQSAGQAGYDESFVSSWISRLLYWDLPGWFFTMLYAGLSLLTILLLIAFPPNFRAHRTCLFKLFL